MKTKSRYDVSSTTMAVLTATFRVSLTLDHKPGKSGMFKNSIVTSSYYSKTPGRPQASQVGRKRRFGPTKLDIIREKLQKIREDFERFSKLTEKTPIRPVDQRVTEADGGPRFSGFADLIQDSSEVYIIKFMLINS